MAVAKPYYWDVAADDFQASFLPRQGPWVPRDILHDREARQEMPANAQKYVVRELTSYINQRARQYFSAAEGDRRRQKYVQHRVLHQRTYVSSARSCVVAEAEVWYHRPGCMHGKVVEVQVGLIHEYPYLVLLNSRVLREEPEDAYYLLPYSHANSQLLSGLV